MTLRTLQCACRVRTHPLCPFKRVRNHGEFREQANFPLVPGTDGFVLTKQVMIQGFRSVIELTGTPVHGETRNLTGPCDRGLAVLRVSGAQWLSKLGLPVSQIQLLGRWSSAAVERYIQTAPLLRLGDDSARLLQQGRVGLASVSQQDLHQASEGDRGCPNAPSGFESAEAPSGSAAGPERRGSPLRTGPQKPPQLVTSMRSENATGFVGAAPSFGT